MRVETFTSVLLYTTTVRLRHGLALVSLSHHKGYVWLRQSPLSADMWYIYLCSSIGVISIQYKYYTNESKSLFITRPFGYLSVVMNAFATPSLVFHIRNKLSRVIKRITYFQLYTLLKTMLYAKIILLLSINSL